MNDLISRQAAIDMLKNRWKRTRNYEGIGDDIAEECELYLKQVPLAQPDRDIPKKPNETTDRAWGIPKRQAVCPNCDAYLGMIHFISKNGKTKVTYCESCGQAINWEGWESSSHRPEGDDKHEG